MHDSTGHATRRMLACAIAMAIALVASTASADRGAIYEVTITNLTRSEVITPPVVFSHRNDFRLFSVGGTPTPGLEVVAEEGSTGDLVAELESERAVGSVVAGEGPIPPGQSATLRLRARHRYPRWSFVAMLATTNDGFVALQGQRFPWTSRTAEAPVYDAGSEANTESCDHMPGPPCGSSGASPDEPGEGFIFIHNGIHGVGDLEPAVWDWRGGAARVSVRRVY